MGQLCRRLSRSGALLTARLLIIAALAPVLSHPALADLPLVGDDEIPEKLTQVEDNGIHVFSDAFTLFPATVTGNVARGNQMDLADDAPHCAGGLWQGNTFQTASRGCIH